MFWFRPKALKTLIEYDWNYEDFPKEPNDTDGTLLHAIERIYPFVAQHEGYYPAWVLNDTFARIETTNLYYMLREINSQYFTKIGPATHYGVVTNLHNSIRPSNKERFKMLLRKYLPRWLKRILKKLKGLIK
jgi:rhamnosyltransferase